LSFVSLQRTIANAATRTAHEEKDPGLAKILAQRFQLKAKSWLLTCAPTGSSSLCRRLKKENAALASATSQSSKTSCLHGKGVERKENRQGARLRFPVMHRRAARTEDRTCHNEGFSNMGEAGSHGGGGGGGGAGGGEE
jgi:hypothetical protein